MKLWGGRFEEETDALMWQFNASIGFDRRLGAADVRGSIAYARALARAGLISGDERDAGRGEEYDRGGARTQPRTWRGAGLPRGR